MKPVGYIDDVTRFSVTGWAADQDDLKKALELVVFVDGSENGKITADKFRLGLQDFAPGATGYYQFRFYFDPPLSPFRDVPIAVGITGSEFRLHPEEHIVKAVCSKPKACSFRPDNAILVSTMGRSGSTLLMHILACNPLVVVADKRPFEVELLTYYSYLFRAMIADGDHEKSLRPDRITDIENRFKIGLNPYFEATFRNNFRQPDFLRDFLNNGLPARLASSFRDIILDFYAAVAQDLEKESPLYFAEKALPEGEIRETSRYLFPKMKELVLVRDLRDAVCSFQQYGGLSFEDSVEFIRSSSIPICNAKLYQSSNVHFVKYEDIVFKPEETIEDIFAFIGLDVKNYDFSSRGDMFQGHGTSESPASSIGRWKKELNTNQLSLCSSFKPFQTMFGYEPM